MNKNVRSLSPLRAANKAVAAEFFDVSLPTIEAWIRRGCPVVERGGKGIPWALDLLVVAMWRFAPQTPAGNADPETMTPMERKAWYEGETRRRELQVRDRELIPCVEVEECTSRAYSGIAQSVFAIPDLLERKAGLSPEQAETCELAVHESMNDLADRLSLLAPELTK